MKITKNLERRVGKDIIFLIEHSEEVDPQIKLMIIGIFNYIGSDDFKRLKEKDLLTTS